MRKAEAAAAESVVNRFLCIDRAVLYLWQRRGRRRLGRRGFGHRGFRRFGDGRFALCGCPDFTGGVCRILRVVFAAGGKRGDKHEGDKGDFQMFAHVIPPKAKGVSIGYRCFPSVVS